MVLARNGSTSGRESAKDERGQSLLELAILLPVLLLILLGILDVGRLYMTMVAIHDAAAEGASYAATHPEETLQIQERAADSSTALTTIDATMVDVYYEAPLSSGQPITVTVNYDYDLLTPVLSAIVPSGTLRLRAIDMRVIY
jgi:Flp pilus assembly protein TadG